VALPTTFFVSLSMFKWSNYRKYGVLLVGSSALLVGCAPPVKVAVEERTVLTVRQQSEKIGGQLVRIVQSGDTLHGIAFASNLDVNSLAAWNGISETDKLLVGQRVRLTKPIGFVAKPRNKERLVETSRSQNRDEVPERSSSSAKQAVPVERVPKTTTSTPSNSIVTLNGSVDKWSWPFNGKIIREFSSSTTQQGIDILGRSGQPVATSAPGEVVYVGNSLKGYGNLIIIKHSEEYLSAYAHNQKILVTEGQKITSLHIIGSVGINNRRENALHFQIRRNGKPVNPLEYLPINVK